MGLLDWFRGAAKGEASSTVAEKSANESAEIGGLDFQSAVAAHQKWKSRLEACIEGTSSEVLDPRIVCQDNQCVLGKWINGTGAAQFGGMATFSQLKVEHAQFHVVAGEILLAAFSGRGSDAKTRLEGVFAATSLRVQSLLARLFLEVSGHK